LGNGALVYLREIRGIKRENLGDLRIGLPQAVRTTTATAATVRAIAGMPARLLPKGGCAFPSSDDTVASLVFDRHAVCKVLAAFAH
jgi:hypothetical protein